MKEMIGKRDEFRGGTEKQSALELRQTVISIIIVVVRAAAAATSATTTTIIIIHLWSHAFYCVYLVQVMYPAIERYLKETIARELELLSEQ